ncbi:hypothetical protein BDR04DRAFT_1086174 [Suillus decipiens]|nr:hypothetical protein BDR04DRAFT_1086174 [Suillus decipiens]
MLTRGPSSPETTFFTSYTRPAPNSCQPASSPSPLAPPSSPMPNTATFDISTSRKRTSDEFQIGNNSSLELDIPSQPKRRK